jgi:hypothetical protein
MQPCFTMFGRLLFAYVISWLYITNNLSLVKTDKSTPKPAKDIFHISSNLAILPEQQCCIWVSTRDIKLRKLNLSTSYRYGLDLQTNRKNSNTIISILLAGEIAINTVPFNLRPIKNEKGLSFCHWNIQWLTDSKFEEIGLSLRSKHKNKFQSEVLILTERDLQQWEYSRFLLQNTWIC